MQASMLMITATLLFATMSVFVKMASLEYGAGEMVFYRGIIGAASMILLTRARGVKLRTRLPAMHCWRSLAGVSALGLWFYAIGELPLSTAVTLNYMAPVWMVVLLIGRSAFLRLRDIDARLVSTVLAGFAGAACILQPAMERDQVWGGLMGLLSGLLTAVAYIQISALGRAGEPEERVVFYFSLGSMAGGALETSFFNAWHTHTIQGLGMLLAIGTLATLAQLLITRAYGIGGLLVNGSLQYLGVAWAYLYGVMLFDDPVGGAAMLGMGLIVTAGIAAAALRPAAATTVKLAPPAD